MDKRLRQYVILVVVVMIFFGFYVRAVALKPKQTVAGPVITHGLDGRYAGRCDICHRKLIPFHEENFRQFDMDNCMMCHGGAPRATHPTAGNETCEKCHDKISASHDLMFPKKVSYENCVGCHNPK